jgi:thiol-disulfide isomerase/thioredoxin
MKSKKMKTKFLIIYIIIFLGTLKAYSQSTAINFLSDKDTKVLIYKPIDGFFNDIYPTDTVELYANRKHTFWIDINNWAIVRCVFQPSNRIDVFTEKDCDVNISYKNDNIELSGQNTALNNYTRFDFLVEESLLGRTLDSIHNAGDIARIEEIIDSPRLLPAVDDMYRKVDSLFADRQISKICYEYFKKELEYSVGNKLLRLYYDNIFGFNSKSMDDTIRNCIYKINKELFERDTTFSYRRSTYYNTLYCAFLHNQLDNETKSQLLGNRDKETFGPYPKFLLAKNSAQLSLFFRAFILQLQYGVNEFDRKEMLNYLTEKYPDSETVAILKGVMAEELNDTTPVTPIFLDRNSIVSFPDILNVEELKNKFLFIDIWASWCIPCRSEFTHNKAISKLFSKYKNIEKVYISIDENTDNWEKAINSLKLSGYHLLASPRMLDYLKKEIYQLNRISVPQYILMDDKGNILNKNMPRPSNIDTLEKELNSWIGIVGGNM